MGLLAPPLVGLFHSHVNKLRFDFVFLVAFSLAFDLGSQLFGYFVQGSVNLSNYSPPFQLWLFFALREGLSMLPGFTGNLLKLDRVVCF